MSPKPATRIAVLVALGCLASSVATLAQSPAPEIESDAWYPRTLTGERGEAIVYAPQIESWEDFETLTGWVAFRATQTGNDLSFYGSAQFRAATDTDVAARKVLLHDTEILELSIDGLEEDAPEYALVQDAFTSMSRKVPLDLVLAYLPQEMDLASTEGLNPEPPNIFSSTSPAMLLYIDGEPILLPIEETGLSFVLNTPWDILRVGENGAFYLCNDDTWLSAATLEDNWAWAESLPSTFSSIPDEHNWTRVRACLPDDLDALALPASPPPDVFYSTVQAELLLLDGEPAWSPIGDRGLSYATNTEQELFRVDDRVFLLLSGRWFESTNITGPWEPASGLPESFFDIPPEDGENEHPMSFVRSSIPGTPEAWEAALVASIPRKAQIQRGAEETLVITVSYAGDPAFAPIEDTGIELATNTSYQVLRYGGVYYLCYNATWLTAFSAQGPWTFADEIPEQFALIPPSSPAYNTTFVKIDGSTDEHIDYEYTSGYEGAYVVDDTVVQGTGWPVTVSVAFAYGMYGGYPYYPYYWWPPTYGYGSWYDPSTGRYGEAVVGYGPYGAAGGAAVFNPDTGVYGRGQAVWDNDEFAGRGYAYNPNTDTSIARNRYVDFEDNEGWSERVARRGDEWRYTESEWEDGRMVTDFESSRGTEGSVVRERDGDTIASEGEVSRGDRSATFESTREREGDALVSEGTIQGENRSANVESVIQDGRYSGEIEGSEGGSGNVNRQLDDGTISGGSTVTKDGKSIETDVTRTAEGVQREFETSGGGQGVSLRSGDDSGFAYQSGSGDVYAGRDGQVYQKTDGGWSTVENPRSASASGDTRSATDWSAQSREQAASTTRQQGARTGASVESFEGVSAGQYSGSRQLDRDYQNRQQGYDRYSRHQATGGRSRRGGAAGRGRRRF